MVRIISILGLLAAFSSDGLADLSAAQRSAYLKNCAEVCRAGTVKELPPDPEVARCEARCKCHMDELRNFSPEEWALINAMPTSEKWDAFQNALRRFNQVVSVCRERK